MKVILLTNGPLYLIKGAEYLTRIIDIKIVQAWIPTRGQKFVLFLASKVVGRDLGKSLAKRTPKILEGKNYSIAPPEFLYWFGRYFLKLDLSTQTAKLFGYLAKKHVRDVEVLHVRSGSGISAIRYAKEKGIKVIVDHSIAHPSYMDKQLRVEYEKYGLKFALGMDSSFWRAVIEDCNQADILLVNSEFVKETFIGEGYDAKRIAVVTQGVRSDFFFLKKDYAKSTPKLKILFTGSFGFRKGGEYILRAMRELDKLSFQYEMIIVGSYTGSEELIKQHASENVIFVGHVLQEELKKYIVESDIYLFPSLSEGCASSAMEAMAAGLPVIVTRETGLPVKHLDDGVLIPSKNVKAIVDAILDLEKNQGKREYLGINAAKKIKESYTWEKYAEQVCQVYQEARI